MASVIVEIYLIGVLLLVTWLGVGLYRHAGEAFQMCSKSDIWSGYVIDCLFWPVILFTKTKTLLSGATFREIVKDPVADLNARQDERFRRLEEMAIVLCTGMTIGESFRVKSFFNRQI